MKQWVTALSGLREEGWNCWVLNGLLYNLVHSWMTVGNCDCQQQQRNSVFMLFCMFWKLRIGPSHPVVTWVHGTFHLNERVSHWKVVISKRRKLVAVDFICLLLQLKLFFIKFPLSSCSIFFSNKYPLFLYTFLPVDLLLYHPFKVFSCHVDTCPLWDDELRSSYS